MDADKETQNYERKFKILKKEYSKIFHLMAVFALKSILCGSLVPNLVSSSHVS